MSSPLPSLLPGASGLPRSVVSIQYLGNDISSLIQPNLIRLSYNDRISYQADSLEFTIADPDGVFRNQFSFKAGNNPFAPRVPVAVTVVSSAANTATKV
jgi:hypothetical protein